MPEGPEIHRHARKLSAALVRRRIVTLVARTRLARAWLETHPDALIGKRIERIEARGKHLIGWIEGGYYFHSHMMMWGRWEVLEGEHPEWTDPRERARIVVNGATAVLRSAPVFELGEGDPLRDVERIGGLGPDALARPFDREEVASRLLSRAHRGREVGALLLDQTIVSGLGNYLRAEILFECRMDPWRRVRELSQSELTCLLEEIPRVSQRAFRQGGVTVRKSDQARFAADPGLTYGARKTGRHYVFRRTNLPCLECATPIRQLRQVTRVRRADVEEDDKTRIIYFCPSCQEVSTTQSQSSARKKAA